nr:MAG TPA: Int protein/DNA Complex protein-DNA complex, tyrosine recombinase.5A [Caudoviricetes sp.]
MWKSIQNKIDNSLGIGTSKNLTAHSFRHNYCTRL